MKHLRLLAPFALLALAACARRIPEAVQPGAPGFFQGLADGFLFPVAWFVHLVVPEIAIYAVPNNGGWYDFGYFLGIVVFGVGANRGRKVVVRTRVVERDRGRTIEHEE